MNFNIDFFNNLAFSENKIWDLLLQGVINKKSKFHTPTLSTIRESKVNSRTIILRKVLKNEKTLVFYSDARSNKCSDIKKNKNCTIHIYESKYNLQTQLYGSAKLENQTKKTKTIWQGLNDFSKKNYSSNISPGLKVRNYKNLKYFQDDEKGYNNFSLINFKVSKIECLQLLSNNNQRVEFIYKGDLIKRNRIVP